MLTQQEINRRIEETKRGMEALKKNSKTTQYLNLAFENDRLRQENAELKRQMEQYYTEMLTFLNDMQRSANASSQNRSFASPPVASAPSFTSIFSPAPVAAASPSVPPVKVKPEPVTQLKTDNLLKIQKRIDRTLNDATRFYGIHLIFDTKQAAKKFMDDYYNYAKHSANPPQLQVLYYYSSNAQDKILEVSIFINTELYRQSSDQHQANNGFLMQEELKKHLDISAIPCVFFNCDTMQEISDAEADQLLGTNTAPQPALMTM